MLALCKRIRRAARSDVPSDERQMSEWSERVRCPSLNHDVQFSVQEDIMKTMSYTESRARYAEVLDGVANDREEVIITRAGHEPVVIVSLEDYESLRETAYLMRSPANARRLLDAMERLETGRGTAHELVETD